MSTISAIYGARKQLGLDEDTARDLYQRETGLRSLRQMSPGQQVRVLQAMRREMQGRAAGPMSGPYAKKLQALWLDGWHLGLIRNRADPALLAFVERQTGLQAVRFLRDATDARRAVEALKKWIARAGGVAWGEHTSPIDDVIAAQGRRLGLEQADADDGSPIGQAWRAWRAGELLPGQAVEVTKLFGDAIRRLEPGD